MKDPLFTNKIAFAFLFFLTLVIAPSIVSGLFNHSSGHGDEMAIEIDITPPSTGNEAQAKTLSFAELMFVADPNIGQKRAAICKSCHSFDAGGANGTGPNLSNIMERGIAQNQAFGYSDSLKSLEGNWTFEMLDAFIENSQAAFPGTSMAQKIRNPRHRAEIIAYLNSLSNNPQNLQEVYAQTTDTASADAASDAATKGAVSTGAGASAVENAVTGAVSTGASAIEKAITGAVKGASAIENAVTDAVNGASSIENTVTDAISTGTDTADDVVDEIKDIAEEVEKAESDH